MTALNPIRMDEYCSSPRRHSRSIAQNNASQNGMVGSSRDWPSPSFFCMPPPVHAPRRPTAFRPFVHGPACPHSVHPFGSALHAPLGMNPSSLTARSTVSYNGLACSASSILRLEHESLSVAHRHCIQSSWRCALILARAVTDKPGKSLDSTTVISAPGGWESQHLLAHSGASKGCPIRRKLKAGRTGDPHRMDGARRSWALYITCTPSIPGCPSFEEPARSTRHRQKQARDGAAAKTHFISSSASSATSTARKTNTAGGIG